MHLEIVMIRGIGCFNSKFSMLVKATLISSIVLLWCGNSDDIPAK